MDLIALILVITVLGGIIWVMFRGRRPSPDSPSFSTLGAFLNGLLVAAAVASILPGGADGWTAGLTVGASIGFLFALLGGGGEMRQAGISVLSGLFGALGLVVSIGSYFDLQGQCTPADVGQRVLGLVLLVAALAIGGLLAALRGYFRLTKLGSLVLAAYGAFEILEFLANPVGVALLQLGATAWIVALVAALGLGFAAAIWPELVIGLGAVVVAAGSLLGAASGGAACTSGMDVSALAPLIGFTAVYTVLRIAVGRFLQTPARK